ncbi:molybdate ABC transporter substrate-binding protein [Pedobacter sp. AW1-32]|uniref:molybdate ABC transporter substrate-binding protein n=1 Tax=Pedobacter sp. AW1-32 TaxID=3383026 RepID=UPI003FF00131
MLKSTIHQFFFSLVCVLMLSAAASAQVLHIAVAANAQGVIKKLQADFKKRTGIETEAIIGASGKLTAQIMNGAPYDIFLSADTEFPDKLSAAGFGLKKPVVYALGSLIVCGSNSVDVKNWQEWVVKHPEQKVVIANPKTAPYGRAAQQALTYYHLLDKVKPNLVYGESISQVNTYLQSGALQLGFTTEAFLYEDVKKTHLKWTRVNAGSYSEIAQSAILLTYARKGNLDNATQFFNYLHSTYARKIIGSSGYYLPVNASK